MSLHEIVTPQTKPETEWVLGRPVRKVIPTRRHSRLQSKLLIALSAWAQGRGEVGTEWRFRIAPPGESRRPLVPDVAYVRNERLRGLSLEEADMPPFPPNVALEVLSEDDRAVVLREKVRVYLAAGSELVIIVDPFTRTVSLIDPHAERTLHEGETIRHDALAGFSLDVIELFSVLELPS